MQNICFSILENEIVKTVTYQDLFRDKRILVCSSVRHTDPLAHRYVNTYLKPQRDLYKDYGIDDVYIVYSLGGFIALAKYDFNCPDIKCLYDNELSFVTYLSQLLNKTQSINTLASYWTYQVLLNNGELEQFYEQPTENQFDHLIADGYSEVVKNNTYLNKKNEHLIFNRPILNFGREQTYEVGGKLFYYNVWPNTKLDSYLGIGTPGRIRTSVSLVRSEVV